MDRRKIVLTALAVILVAGFLLRLFPVRGGYHYWDETVYLQHAEILTGESPDVYNEFDFRPPLFSLILAGTFLLNSSLFSAHLAVAGLSSLTVIMVFILGRELYSRQTAIIAAAIYALSPLGIILSHDILVDPILPLFWLLTAISLNKALNKESKIYFILTGLMASLAVLMKFTSLVILPAIASIVLISYFRNSRIDKESLSNNIRQFLLSEYNWLMAASFFAGILPYLLWSYLEFGSALHVFTTAMAKSGATDAFLTYLNGLNMYILAPLYVGILIFFLKSDLKKIENFLPIIFFISLYIPLQLYLGNKETRFLMPVVPFMALIAAEGLTKLRKLKIFENRRLAKAIFAFLVLTSLIMVPSSMPERNVFAQGFTAEWDAPVMQAGEWLNQNSDEDSIVYTNFQYPALGYYSKRDIVWFREYQPMNQVIGEEILEPGYLYYSKDSPYPHPTLEELESNPRFELNKTIENNVYLYYFTGISR
jgi:4-amino-4-deoxy-L-arabinose transferase-like glycosyltransferase